MEHLVVRFQNHLPYRLEGLNDRSVSFQIPKTERLKTLQFMKKHPQYIIKKRQVVVGSDWYSTTVEAKRWSEHRPHLPEWIEKGVGTGTRA